MITILLVEDEPSAMRYIKAIIKKRCNGFEIIDTAENGAEALEKIKVLRPDVVITDVKMPVVDGIQLVSHIRDHFPFIYSIIISGYQDFEYVKGAVKAGVVDYILKPVNPNQLKTLLESIQKKLNKEHYVKRVELLRKAVSGIYMDTWEIRKYLPFQYYSVAILRQNGLPARFSSKDSTVDNSLLQAALSLIDDKNIWLIAGRDEREVLFFYTPEILDKNYFEALVRKMAVELMCGYYTILFASDFFQLKNIKEKVSYLYRMLDSNIVIGFSQILYEDSRLQSENKVDVDASIEKKITFLVSNAMYDELKQELEKLFAEWKKQRRTQLWIESNLRYILYIVKKFSTIEDNEKKDFDLELMLDEILYSSMTLDELKDNVLALIERITKFSNTCNKIDTPAFFNSIERYIRHNFSDQISLQSVCSTFGISQSYLSRLFRKYKGVSFNEYLTQLRIEEAKRIIQENPDMPIKDVALLVGYNDQFYFSRVFRTIVGVPPSEYIDKVIKKSS